MTVLDTSAAVDFMLGVGVAGQVEQILREEDEVAAPDLLVFEALAVLRRATRRRAIPTEKAARAVIELGELPVILFPCLPLRTRAWELRENLTAADALFVALAEQLDEPLATKDGALAGEAVKHARLDVLHLQER